MWLNGCLPLFLTAPSAAISSINFINSFSNVGIVVIQISIVQRQINKNQLLLVQSIKNQMQTIPQCHQNHQENTSLEGSKREKTAEQIIKEKYDVCLQHKHLIEELFCLEEKELLTPFTYLWNQGGKMINVIAALVIHDLFDHRFTQQAVRVGGLIELLRCASLLIDDIEDGSIQRRGNPCSHSVYGADCSINAANLMYFLPLHKLVASFPSPQLKWKINEIFVSEMVSAHIGQGIDINAHKATSKGQLLSHQDYIKLASMKTGGLMRMLVRMIGAVMGISQAAVDKLSECINYVGIAFQIMNDILNVANAEECASKGVVAEDLHQRKFTLIIDYLRDNQEFISLYLLREKDQSAISRMLQIIKEGGVVEQCRAKAREYTDKALKCLEQLECSGDKRAFELFIKFIIERKN